MTFHCHVSHLVICTILIELHAGSAVLQYRKLLFNGTFYNGFQIEQTNRSHRLPNHLEPRLPTPLPTYKVHQPVLLHPLQSGAMVVVVAHDIAPSDSAFFGQLPLRHRGAPSLLTSWCFLLSVAALSPPYSTASSSRRAVHSASFPLPPPPLPFPESATSSTMEAVAGEGREPHSDRARTVVGSSLKKESFRGLEHEPQQ